MTAATHRWIFGLMVGSLCLVARGADAQSAENVLLVVNSTSTVSQQVGDYYARARAIPQDNILRIAIESNDQVPRRTYEAQLEIPIVKWIEKRTSQDRLLYIVLTKGIPLRVAGTSGRNGTVASVDSELTLLYRKMTGIPVPADGRIPNPYFLGERPTADARPFTHERADIFLVTRLDGFSFQDIQALIDRGVAPKRDGRIALDEKVSLTAVSGNRWLERGAELLKAAGFGDRVLLESTSQMIANEDRLLGYYSWGSNDPSSKSRDLKLGFEPGALAAMFVSTDARTFRQPPAEWKLGKWEDGRTYFEGSPQSLIGDLIHQGVTGAAGHVAEPYLDAAIRPDVLFPAYLAGFNLAESFYLAMPYLSWQTVVVGDPLCAPFKQRVLSASEIDRGVDAVTAYPTSFSNRLVELYMKSTTVADAATAMVRATARLRANDVDGTRKALEQATTADPRLMEAHMLLAQLYDQLGEIDQAIERYRKVLALKPNNAAAMNNLVYTLAVNRPGAIQEALKLVRTAATISRNDPPVLDTLAWVLHLSNNDAEARPFALLAAKMAPDNADIQLHAAFIDASVGSYETAARSLARAMQLNPEFDKLADVQELRTKLGRLVRQ